MRTIAGLPLEVDDVLNISPIFSHDKKGPLLHHVTSQLPAIGRPARSPWHDLPRARGSVLPGKCASVLLVTIIVIVTKNVQKWIKKDQQ